METYIQNVKDNVAGQAVVKEFPFESANNEEDFPPPPSAELLDQLSQEFGQSSLSPNSAQEGKFFARPINGASGPTGARHKTSITVTVGPKPFGSTSSSLGSSRNATPSPTSSSEEHANVGGAIPNLSRPSQFAGKPGSRKASININSIPLGGASGALPEVPPMTPGGNYMAMGVKKTAGRKCVKCGEDFRPGDVAIHAERAGPEMYWHPNCFKCSTCEVKQNTSIF